MKLFDFTEKITVKRQQPYYFHHFISPGLPDHSQLFCPNLLHENQAQAVARGLYFAYR